MIIGFIFSVIFFVGETYGFLPTIVLEDLVLEKVGDNIILFVIVLMGSVFLGSLLVFLMIRKT